MPGSTNITRKFITAAHLLIAALLLVCIRTGADDKEACIIDDRIQTIYSAEDGLLSTSSTAIAQTSDGYIWIGSYGGLVRYDGKEFRPYGAGELSNVTALYADPENGLWIASADRGLVRYKDGELSYVSEEQTGGRISIQCLTESGDGTIWFGTDSGIGSLSPEDAISKPDIEELSGQLVSRILATSKGDVLCVTRSGSLFRYDRSGCAEITPEGMEGQIRCVAEGADGRFYIGTSGDSVVSLTPEFSAEETISAGELNTVNEIIPDAEGNLWICSDSGVGVFTDGTFYKQNLLIDNSIDQMLVDHEGSYWFVSSRQGVLEVSESRFGDVSQSAGLGEMVVNAVVELDGRLYAGHDDGIAILDARTFDRISDPEFEFLKSVRIRCLYTDSRGCLWVCTKGKGVLCRLPDGSWKEYNVSGNPEIGSDNFRCIAEYDGGMIAGSDAGAYIITDDGVRNVLNHPDELGVRILSVVRDGDATYLGTDGYGLYIVRDGEIAEHFSTDNGLSSNVIMRFTKGRIDGRIWMITGNSISYVSRSGDSFSVSKLEGFPSTNNLDFLIMDDGDVWIPSGTGIYQTGEKQLIDGDMTSLKLYQSRDGLPYEPTANSYQFLDDDGLLYLCGSGGISSLKTDSAAKKKGSYTLVLDEVISDGETSYIGNADEVYIGANVQRVSFPVRVLTYLKENPLVYCFLEGFDHERTIHTLKDLPMISYTNLDGGDYTFRFGVLDEETGEPAWDAALHVKKEYRWFETMQFKAGAIAAVLGLIALLAFGFSVVREKRIQSRLAKHYEELEKQHLKEMAYKDYLTGLYNRNYLGVWTEKILPKSEFPVTFITVDVNGLKKINDSYGHKEGDRLLVSIAELLQAAFDDECYTVFRNGGDEFLVLCTGTDSAKAGGKIEELRKMASKRVIGGREITFCSGTCTMDQESFALDEGMAKSDLKMLEEKSRVHAGRMA